MSQPQPVDGTVPLVHFLQHPDVGLQILGRLDNHDLTVLQLVARPVLDAVRSHRTIARWTGSFDWAPGIERLCELQHFPSLMEVDLGDCLLTEIPQDKAYFVELLARIAGAGRLKKLTGLRVLDEGSADVMAAAQLSTLKELGMRCDEPGWAVAVMQNGTLIGLEKLGIVDSDLTGDEAADLALVDLPQLKTLDVRANTLSCDGVALLAAKWASIKHLSLEANALDDIDSMLSAISGLCLIGLNVNDSEFKSYCFATLAAFQPVLSVVETLQVAGLPLLGALAGKYWGKLDLSNIQVLDARSTIPPGVDLMEMHPSSPYAMRELYLGPCHEWNTHHCTRNRLTGPSMAALCGTQGLTHLQVLDLRRNDLVSEDIRALASTRFPLEHLYLGHNRLTGPDLETLSHAPWAGQLRTLDVRDNDIGRDAVLQLLPSFRSLQVVCTSEELPGAEWELRNKPLTRQLQTGCVTFAPCYYVHRCQDPEPGTRAA